MSAETSHITDISGGASGTATSPKKANPTAAKRVGDAPRVSATSGTPGNKSAAWAAVPSVDVTKFFEEGRERVREAFEQANGRFDTIRSAARETGDVLQESHVAAINGAKDINEQLFEYVQTEVDRGYDFLKSATEAKGVSELMQLQTDYVRESWETQVERTRTLSELTFNVFKSAFSPLQSGFSSVIENARKRG